MNARRLQTCRAPVVLLALVLVSFGVFANGTRVTVLNEVLAGANDASLSAGLYFSRLGTYYAELYLERDGAPVSPPAPVAFTLAFRFRRGEEILLARDVTAHFVAGRPVTTLLYLDVPRDLPQRDAITMDVRVPDFPAALREPATTLRLQLTRKVQLSPLQR